VGRARGNGSEAGKSGAKRSEKGKEGVCIFYPGYEF